MLHMRPAGANDPRHAVFVGDDGRTMLMRDKGTQVKSPKDRFDVATMEVCLFIEEYEPEKGWIRDLLCIEKIASVLEEVETKWYW